MPNAAEPQLLGRFRDDLTALAGDGATSARFGVAVSGGPDSMALLWLTRQALGERVEAATVDHGLRREAADEARMVADWCAGQGIAHATLRPASPISGSIQQAARQARYALLERWRTARGLAWLLTAHHADDQAETMMMRLNRGSGVGGLAGVRARNGVVLRPILGWRRADLLGLVEAEGVPFVRDPSNEDERFDRAAMRARLAGAGWIDAAALARSAAACADADDALDWMVERILGDHLVREGEACLRLPGFDFPREIQRRIVLRLLTMVEPDFPAPRGQTIDKAIIHIRCGRKVTVGNWLLRGNGGVSIQPAPPRGRR